MVSENRVFAASGPMLMDVAVKTFAFPSILNA
jgi:hypothetical protein